MFYSTWINDFHWKQACIGDDNYYRKIQKWDQMPKFDWPPNLPSKRSLTANVLPGHERFANRYNARPVKNYAGGSEENVQPTAKQSAAMRPRWPVTFDNAKGGFDMFQVDHAPSSHTQIQ